MRVRSLVAAVTTVLLGAGLAACTSDDGEGDGGSGGGSSSLTYLGDRVVDAEATLTQATALWRTTWPTWGQVLTVPDDSRCWFLADEAGAVESDGLCGPFRGLGTRSAEWVLVRFTARPADGGVRLTPTVLAAYDEEAGYNSKRIVDAGGTEGERDVDVPEPSGWPKVMRPGQSDAHPMRVHGREQLVRTKVRVLGHDYSLRIVSARRAQFSDRSLYVPPKGGAFVDFRFRAWDSDGGFEAMEALRKAARTGRVKLRVETPDRVVSGAVVIPEQRGKGLRIRTYGPSGFFSVPSLEGATFVVRAGAAEYVLTAGS